MLKEPDFPLPSDDGKSYVCLEDGQYIAYLDCDAASTLLYNLYWFYDAPPGEESGVWSAPWGELSQRGQPIGYCEFNMVPDHVQKKQGKNILKEAQPPVRQKPHGIFNPQADRLDYFVSPAEVKNAYDALTVALQNNKQTQKPLEVTLFETLVVRLI